MKVKLLLCMMALWAMCAAAQPRVLEDGFRLMPNPNQVTVKPMKVKGNAMKNMVNTTTKRNKARADEPTYQVDCVLDFDTVSQKAGRIEIVNLDTYIVEYAVQKGSNILSVPAGTYDIIASFYALDTTQPYESWLYIMNVIREQVTISEGMTMEFAASEAKNHIHFQTFTIDGEPVYTGKWALDENWNWIQLEQGNTDDLCYANYMICKDIDYQEPKNGNFGVIVEGELYHSLGGEMFSDYYVNDVSDRWAFYSARYAFRDKCIYTSAYEVQGASGDVTITNDPTKFKLYEEPFKVAKHQGEDLYLCLDFFARQKTNPDFMSSSFRYNEPLAEDETFKCYLSASPDDSNLGVVPYIQPYVDIKALVTQPWGEEEDYVPVLVAQPLTLTNSEPVYANNGMGMYENKNERWVSFANEYSEEIEDEDWDIIEYPYWPTHPAFTYPTGKKKGDLGNNCPVFFCNATQYESSYNEIDENGNPVLRTKKSFIFDYDYAGRYGEKRPDDVTYAQVSIKLNGEEIITGQGSFAAQMDELLNGVIDATIINETVQVDDMTGFNKAQLHYTAGTEDQNAPTMTMLHFKVANGDVTDRFSTADEGTLEFTAGDFNFWFTPKDVAAFERQAPESVEVSYSPYGEDNWNELAVEEVPENYWPVMGWFYSGSLAGVTGQGLNGWFDLKIRLTDAAGNWQEQVLSPAFRIDDLAYSSVVTITPDKVGENAIYNLAGQRMRGGLNSLPHGIYIVGGKKVVK